MGASYSRNVACLARRVGRGEVAVEQVFSPYFPPRKPRCVLWSGASYSPKYVNLLHRVGCSLEVGSVLKINLFVLKSL